MEARFFTKFWRSLPPFPDPSQINSVRSRPCPVSSISVLSSHPEYGLFLHQNPACKSPCHIQPTCSALLILLNLKTLIIFYEQHKSWSFSLCNFLQPPVISPLFSKLHNLCSLPHCQKLSCIPIQNNRQNQSSIYILIFMSLRGQKYKWFYTEWQQQTSLRYNLLGNSTSMQFSCVSVSVTLWILTLFRRFTCCIYVVILPATYEHPISLFCILFC